MVFPEVNWAKSSVLGNNVSEANTPLQEINYSVHIYEGPLVQNLLERELLVHVNNKSSLVYFCVYITIETVYPSQLCMSYSHRRATETPPPNATLRNLQDRMFHFLSVFCTNQIQHTLSVYTGL
jgi:hypothetical protein